MNGKIYAIGGSVQPGWLRPDVEVYDPPTDTWERKADMPDARAEFTTSAVDGKIYVFTNSLTFTQSVLIYIPPVRTSLNVTPTDKLATAWGQ